MHATTKGLVLGPVPELGKTMETSDEILCTLRNKGPRASGIDQYSRQTQYFYR